MTTTTTHKTVHGNFPRTMTGVRVRIATRPGDHLTAVADAIRTCGGTHHSMMTAFDGFTYADVIANATTIRQMRRAGFVVTDTLVFRPFGR